MTKLQKQVREFHEAFDIKISDAPTIVDEPTKLLRYKLIKEEFGELVEAMVKNDLVGIADGLGDLLYVIYGAAVSFGIDLEPVTDEIHRSNMTKVGGHKREDGKWVKPESYSPADIKSVLEAQK